MYVYEVRLSLPDGAGHRQESSVEVVANSFLPAEELGKLILIGRAKLGADARQRCTATSEFRGTAAVTCGVCGRLAKFGHHRCREEEVNGEGWKG